MFARLVGDSFTRNPRRKVLTAAALVLGMAVTTATLTVALDVGDRLAREFRSLGANLLVVPQSDTLPLEIGGVDYRPVNEGAYLPEADLGKLKTIFWRHNIVGFTPFLDVPVGVQRANAEPSLKANADANPRTVPATLIGTWYQHSVPVPDGTEFITGAAATHPWWKIRGRWFGDPSNECVAGAALAARAQIQPGDTLEISAGQKTAQLTVVGIVSTGGAEDQSILAPLRSAQELAGEPGKFRQLLVSALTKPEDAFAQKDPASMTPTEYDRWFCSPYISSISLQIRQVLPETEVRPIRRVAETEGRILTRVSALLWIVTLAALIAASLAVGATSATTVLERRVEVGLMKALGATNGLVAALFLGEQLMLAIAGGGLGFVLGIGLARVLGESVFGVPSQPRAILLPVVLALAILVAWIGSFFP
ncbi:MAG: ABC transporter permease, partial [Candidatus Acidiferrales bacterium]